MIERFFWAVNDGKVGWIWAAEVHKCHVVMKLDLLDLRDVRSHISGWSEPFLMESPYERPYVWSCIWSCLLKCRHEKVALMQLLFIIALGKGLRRGSEKRKRLSCHIILAQKRRIGGLWALRCLYHRVWETPGWVIVHRCNKSCCLSSTHAYSDLSTTNNGAQINAGMMAVGHDGLMLYFSQYRCNRVKNIHQQFTVCYTTRHRKTNVFNITH